MGWAATWTVKQPDTKQVSELARALGVGDVTAACLVNRGYTSYDASRLFLSPQLADLKAPDGMVDLNRAAERVADAIINNERVAVFGDYDVDGISSAALMTLFLRKLGVPTTTLLADRFQGYGMTPDIIDQFSKAGCSVIVAVDCGTSDHEAAARSAQAGIDLIVIDHHRIEGAHPDVYAFVNPERKDCNFGDTTLAAVGLTFYFAAAIRTVLTNRGHIQRGDMDLRLLLDLVALGTVADVMPLKGNNRILVSHGLRQMSKTPREGLRSLIRTARIRSHQIRSDHIAYQLAPRLNAAGRLGEAGEALDLLIVDDRRDSLRLAERLDQLSQERRLLETSIVDAAKAQAEADNFADDPVLVIAGEGWHRGVLGIVAARIVEWSGKPAFIIGFEGGVGIGSARGRGQINLHECLSSVSQYLLRFGGHRDAAGFTVDTASLASLKTSIKEYARENWTDADTGDIVCDAKLDAFEVNAELLKEIGQLGPFGAANSEPIFEVNGLYVLDSRVVGTEHLKLELKTPSGTIGAFGPRLGEFAERIPPLVRVAANLTPDEWRGDGTPELRLVAPPVQGT